MTKEEIKSSQDQRTQVDEDAPGADMENPILALERTYPRIARHIIEFWSAPNELNDYLIALTLMDRQGRSGFPDAAMANLLDISRCTATASADDLDNNPWFADVRLNKSFRKDEIEKSHGFRYRSKLSGAETAIIDMSDIKEEIARGAAGAVAPAN